MQGTTEDGILKSNKSNHCLGNGIQNLHLLNCPRQHQSQSQENKSQDCLVGGVAIVKT